MIALQTLRRLFLGSTVLLLQLPNLAQAETPIAALPVVKPAISCAALTRVDLQAIGGKGSQVVSASETTSKNTEDSSPASRMMVNRSRTLMVR